MIPLVFLLAAAIPASPAPAGPVVGDPVMIELRLGPGERLAIDPSPHFEIVKQDGGRLIVRTFEPRPFDISGKIVAHDGKARSFAPLRVSVRSVLAPGDRLQAAPLVPPRPDAMPRLPLIAIGVAGFAAIAMCILAYLLARRRTTASMEEESPLAPAERYRNAIAALRSSRAFLRWAALADATRAYLAAVAPELGMELTSRELIAALERWSRWRDQGRGAWRDEGRGTRDEGLGVILSVARDPLRENPDFRSWEGDPSPSTRLGMTPSHSPLVPRRSSLVPLQPTIAEILHQGDLEKFSPWGAIPGDFEALAVRALAIPEAFEPAPEEAAA